MMARGLIEELKGARARGQRHLDRGSRVHPFAGAAMRPRSGLASLTREMASDSAASASASTRSRREIDTSILSPGNREDRRAADPAASARTPDEVAKIIYVLGHGRPAPT